MTAKRIITSAIAAVLALSLAACGDIDESSSKKEKAAPLQSEISSAVTETETSEPESSENDSSEADSSEPEQTAPPSGAESLEEFEKTIPLVLGQDGETAIAGLDKAFGISHGEPKIEEGLMNAAGQRFEDHIYAFDGGYELLGQRLYRIDLDCVSDDKTVFTVGFHMNTDINTHEGHDPEWKECKAAYESLYKMLSERYGEPDEKFTPEVNDYFGALWKDTPCGEIWISWAEKIFQSEQPDLIISFSVSGTNGI